MKIHIFSVFIIVVLLGVLLYTYTDKKGQIQDINNKYVEAMEKNKELEGISDFLSDSLDRINLTSKKRIKKLQDSLNRYMDSLKRVTGIANDYVYGLDNTQLANTYRELIDADDGIRVQGTKKDTSFIIEPINIRKTVVLINERQLYKDLYDVTLESNEFLEKEVQKLNTYKEASDSLVSLLETRLHGKELMEESLKELHEENIQKLRAEHKKKKIRSFLYGAGAGGILVGLLILL